MSHRTLEEVRAGSGSLGEVQDRSVDPRGGPGPDKGPSGKSETGVETLE